MISQPKNQLRKPQPVFSLLDSTAVMVGIVIGVGIYETAPLVASCLPGTVSMLTVWALGGVLSLAGALCYAELASTYPQNGGDYIYLSKAYGDTVGYLFAWASFAIIRPGSIAAMAFPFAHYLEGLWSPFRGTLLEGSSTVLFATGGVVLLTGINCIKVSASAWAQNVLTLLKILGLFAIFVAAVVVTPSESISSVTVANSKNQNFGLALILVLFTYGGWQEIGYVAAEVRHPEKNLSRSILLCVLIVTCLYLLTNFAFVWALGYTGLTQSTIAASDTLAVVFPHWGPRFMSALICLSAMGAMNGLILTGSRISHVLGRDYPLFRILGGWNSARGTPLRALLVQALMSIFIVVLSGSFSSTVVYTTAVVWIFFTLTGFSVLILRYKNSPNTNRRQFPFNILSMSIFCISALYLAYNAFVYDWKGSLVSIGIVGLGWCFKRSPRSISEEPPPPLALL